jgi:hypothetical protein
MGATSDWINHGFTCRLRRELETQSETALKALLAECRKSQDAQVTKRLAEYEQLRSFLAQLGKEAIDGSDDGDDD